MASYQTRQRDPLLDSETQAVLERRGKELLGLGLIVLGLLTAAMLFSYSPDDPSWISATQAPVSNWLGAPGAAIAAPVMMIVGLGIWALPMTLLAWGVRFMMHSGSDRAGTRVVFAPIVIVVAALYAATLTPGANWPPNFGLGGLLGDTVLGMVLTILPVSAAFSIKVLTLILAAATVALLAFALGFTRAEIRHGLRFVMLGTVMLYDTALRLLNTGTLRAAQAAGAARSNMAARREERAAQAPAQDDARARAIAAVRANPGHATSRKMPPIIRADGTRAEPPLTGDTMHVAEKVPQPSRKTPGIGSLLRRKAPEPEMVETAYEGDIDSPPEDRISSRISDAVRARTMPPAPVVSPEVTGVRIEPSLTEGRRPKALVLPKVPPLTQSEPAMDAFTLTEDEDDTVIEPEAPAVYQRSPLPREEAAPLVAQPLFDPDAPRANPAEPRRAVVQHELSRKVVPSKQARAEAQPELAFEDKFAAYEMPPLNLLADPAGVQRHVLSDEALEENARMLENVLDDYGVKGEIVSVRPGPVVTMYELEPAPGLKASRVIGLADDIARSMSALSARVSTVPGRTVIGIELPNENREKVVLREILSARDFGDSAMKLPLALGKDIGGQPIVANLAKMPHLLIAGTTGSGKSVAINTMILSLLYKLSPEECRMIMIDPKMLELSVYDGIPHLLSPVVTDPKKAVVALKWVVGEMEERYRKMSKMGVRNIDGYNGRVREALAKDEMFSRTVQTGFDDETGEPVFETDEFKPEVLPYIVVVVDEMADLMMVAGKEIEACIQRLAQMARASGIHLIMATQRPSVDVITGTIKANFPTRISFQVTSKIDSRTILGEMGAEQLLGMGDMLYMAGGSKVTRVHGPFCSDEEVEEIVNYLKSFGPPEYMSGVVEGPSEDAESSIDLVLGLGDGSDAENALYDTAVAIVIKDRKCSTSYIQRKLAIGYNKAARLVEQMEDEGVVSAANHVGKREILVPEQH
ncbi:DNA segregation ATPase FtsK/SpoIIIE, S-DNA-T family [Loktanella sp. DSM 29012]|uniref:DNA translocase FtsK n=1 Tax=Loktanella sp. DSM 29012 TaxID=1881056 RepID=UPI0008D0C807|nr:DNA translocase FtsK [Loktanella sp. DSM 29012]SEP62941.1 DNA segregation ATPase FtsK/SpoIIIE, S-DNA-T family [Loktanella sp. DSM 29012]